MLTFERAGTGVRSMMMNGVVVLPPSCDPTPTGARATLCTPAFRHLAHDLGAASAHLVASHDDGQGETFVFAAVFEGGGECGSYGFWVIRVDTKLWITPPIDGCFHLDDQGSTPIVRWGPPLTITTSSGYGEGQRTTTFVLNEHGFVLVPK